MSLTNIEIDDFYQDRAIADVQKTQITAAQVNLIKENTERDIRLQFEKIVKGESTGASFTERYEALRKNLGLRVINGVCKSRQTPRKIKKYIGC